MQDLYKGAILIAPMISLEKISRSGLNPYLRCVHLALQPITHKLLLHC